MRLIDADALKDNAVDVELPFPPFNKRSTEPIVFLYDIEDAPTIDAEPVRHGRWMNKGYITTAYGSIDTGDCSACGAVDVPIEPYDSYCPNCGAKMDLEVKA